MAKRNRVWLIVQSHSDFETRKSMDRNHVSLYIFESLQDHQKYNSLIDKWQRLLY